MSQSPIHVEMTAEEREHVTYHFVKAWLEWNASFEVRDRMEQGYSFNNADSHLYEAIGLAGLKWPWEYRLPRNR